MLLYDAMDRSTLEQLAAFEPGLRAAGLSALYVFGSRANRKVRPGSDIDLLFDVDPRGRFSLIDQARIQAELAEALGLPVDLIERSALRPALRRRVEAESVRIFS